MIALRFSDLRSECLAPDHPADVFIGVTADLELVTDAGLIYSEPEFPVVELAAEIRGWLEGGATTGQDFEFDSMETPEPGWIWIRRVEGGWRVGSVHQHKADPEARDFEEVRTAIRAFLAGLAHELRDRWGIDLDRYTKSRDT
ncbi:hypothetical protein [Nitriliruptor alkaliphilus]|uniref:DUF7878 domain-containing protein n=1 Tax=Nitriliruptor alkaliphilus TaxID=427918 RepID=UPI0006983810|nr:hypothetical protein [Nitriliruptor alkaliphilus]